MTAAPRDAVRYATAAPSDRPAILALNQANVPHVGPLDAAKLARLHAEAASLRVARVGDEIVGFVLAMIEKADYESPNFRWFVERYPRFTYVDRIAVADEWRGRGIGRGLYEAVEAMIRTGAIDDRRRSAQRAPDWLTCEVNLVPPNPGSMSFHERLGFAGVGERWDEVGGTGVRMMAKAVRSSPHRHGDPSARQ